MSKFLFTGDWQCHVNNIPQCELALDQLLAEIKTHQVQHVFMLGDIKHVLNPVDQRVTNFLISFAKRVSIAKAQLHCVLGNHDKIGIADISHSCFPVLRAAGACTYEDPVHIDIDGITLYVVPWIRDAESLRKAYKGGAKADYLLFHSEVQSCKLNVHSSEKAGRVTLEGMHAKQYKLCIGGHIHYQQKIGDNVWYTGSPFPQDWGEVNQRKGFLLVDHGTFKVKRIKSLCPGWYDPDAPEFKAPESWEGARVRVRVPVSNNIHAELAKATRKAEKKYPGAHLHVVPEYSPTTTVDGAPGSFSSDTSILRHFLKENAPGGRWERIALPYIQSRLPENRSGIGLSPVHFTSVNASDVLSYKNCFLQLDKPGLTLVTGENRSWAGNVKSNGAGKSNLLGLPTLALFGQTPKQQKHDKWRRRSSDGSSILRLDLLVGEPGNQKKVSVVRGRNPAILSLAVDDKDLTMGDAAGTQKLIESLTGLTMDVLINSLYIGQKESATILYGSDKERKELFTRFLGLQRFAKAAELVNRDIKNTTATSVLLEEDIEVYRDRLHNLKTSRSSGNVATLKKEAALHLAKLSSDKKKLLSIEVKQKKLNRLMGRSIESGVVVSERGEYRQIINNLTTLRETLTAKGPRKCPTCGQTVKKQGSDNKERVVELDRELAAARKALSKEEARIQAEKQSREEKVKRARRFSSRAEELRKKATKLGRECYYQRQSLIEIKAAIKTFAREVRVRATLQRLKAAREALGEEVKFLQWCMSLLGRNGIPSFLCAQVCPQLNTAAERYSDLFAGGAIKVQFTVTEGELDVSIENSQGGESIQDQSMGELRIAGLISVFAFREVLVPSNILILDEPGEGLDATNASVFAKALSEVSKRFGSVFVTSHNSNILSSLEPDRHLQVIKEDGVSRLAEL